LAIFISILITSHHLSLSFSTTSAPTAAYNIQSAAISAQVMSVFSLSVSTTISGLTISEFILWTTDLRKQIELYIN
jgi:hypothetical protein